MKNKDERINTVESTKNKKLQKGWIKCVNQLDKYTSTHMGV